MAKWIDQRRYRRRVSMYMFVETMWLSEPFASQRRSLAPLITNAHIDTNANETKTSKSIRRIGNVCVVRKGRFRSFAIPAARPVLSRANNDIVWLDAEHRGGIVNQPRPAAEEDVPHPLPYYTEMHDTAKLMFWRSIFGEDKIYAFYDVLKGTIAIMENLAHPAFGKLMHM